jgi:hypothetical protein
VIYLDYPTQRLGHAYSEAVLIQYPFDELLADHCGLDEATGGGGGLPEDCTSNRMITYGPGASYDEMWNWDAITDPEIRDLVYERYTPFNLE